MMSKIGLRGFAFGVGGSIAVVFFTVVVLITYPKRSVAQLAGNGGEVMDCTQVPPDEFLVTTNAAKAERADIAMDAEGNFVTVWTDRRTLLSHVFAQRHDRYGNKLGGEFQVGLPNTETSIQHYPQIAMDPPGNFVIAWFYNDSNDFTSLMYIQRYDSNGNPVGGKSSIVDPDFVGEYAVAKDPAGNFIVAWSTQILSDIFAVKAQRFDANGNKLGGVITVSSWEGEWLEQHYRYIRIATDQQRNFIITWSQGMKATFDYRPDVYYQKFNSNGVKIGSAVKVAPGVKEDIRVNAIAANTNGELIVTWEKYFDSMVNPVEYHIFAQKYGADNRPVGGAFQIDRVYTNYAMGSKIGFDSTGNFTIAWEANNCEYGVCATEIVAQKFDASQNRVGEEFIVNSYWDGRSIMDMATNLQGNVVFTWWRDDFSSLYAKIICPGHCSDSLRDGGEPAIDCGGECQSVCMPQCLASFSGGTQRVNIATQSDAKHPVVKKTVNGNYIIAWQSRGNMGEGQKIFARIYDRNGNSIRAPFIIGTEQNWFDFDVSSDGSWVIAWPWRPAGGGNELLYAQRYDSLGNALSPQVIVASHGPGIFMQGIDVSADRQGNYVIAWHDYYTGQDHLDIFAQRVNGNGEKIGTEIKVNSDGLWPYNYNPVIAIAPEGYFTILWSGRDRDVMRNFAQRFDGTGEKIGTQFQINVESPDNLTPILSAATDADGNAVVVWTSYEKVINGWLPGDIYAQRFTSQWEKIGSEQRVNHLGKDGQDYPFVAMNADGFYAITWRDTENDWYPRIMMKRFDAQGNALGVEVAVDDPIIDAVKSNYGIALDNSGDIVVVWQRRISNGYTDSYYRIITQDCQNCADGIKNYSETDVDCGGRCNACPAGKMCMVEDDCISAYCNPDKICALPSCSDGWKNGDETDVDCGGSCGRCANTKLCLASTDCQSNYCNPDNICAIPSCTDGLQNGRETGVDCGGSCAACPCTENWQCSIYGVCRDGKHSRTCTDANACQTTVNKPIEEQVCASCDDGVKNQDEVLADCGGICSPCQDKCLPLLLKGSSEKKIDLLFIPDNRYGSDLSANVTHADGSQTSFKYDVISKKVDMGSVPPLSVLMDKFNIFYSQEPGDAETRTLSSLTDYATSCPQIDAAVILHPNNLDDATAGSLFTAEGHRTKAFMHESGHGIFGLADEYNSAPRCYTHYFQPKKYANIWWTDAGCKADAVSSGLWPESACHQFTTCNNGFSKMSSNGDNIMVRGLPTDTFDAASYRRVQWVFEQTVAKTRPAGSYGVGYEQGESPKTVVVTYAIDGSQIRAVGSTVVGGYAPDYLTENGPFNLAVASAGGSTIEAFSISDPRLVLREDNGEGPRIEFQNATFTVAFPYYPTLKSATIAHEEDPAFTVTTNLERVLGNICATRPSDADCQAVDVDDDGILGETDNCPTITNPDQLDSNSNGIGDRCEPFRRADSNVDYGIDISDAINTLGYLFTGTATVSCTDAADSNDDGALDISDAVFTLSWLFLGGKEIPAPGSTIPGPDPTFDTLQCQRY